MILDQILETKRREVEARKSELPIFLLKAKIPTLPPTRNFKETLRRNGKIALIAEIKKASPSAGLIRQDFDPVRIGQIYEENGAAAISILTEIKYFQGSLDHLRKVKQTVTIPVLRKDFIFDPYQIYESRICGADAVLLITRILDLPKLTQFLGLAQELGMAGLVEIHSAEELNMALAAGAEIIGINNRDLDTLEVNLSTTYQLSELIPADRIIVSESGIQNRADVIKLKNYVNAVLVGEVLMKSEDIGEKVRELLGRDG